MIIIIIVIMIFIFIIIGDFLVVSEVCSEQRDHGGLRTLHCIQITMQKGNEDEEDGDDHYDNSDEEGDDNCDCDVDDYDNDPALHRDNNDKDQDD